MGIKSVKELFGKIRYSKGHAGILVRGAIGVFVIKVIGTGLLFGLHLMLARLLGAKQYGIYVYAFTWINILAILGLLGFETSLVRFISEYNIKQQWGLLHGILRKSQQFVLGFSIFVSLAGVVAVSFMQNGVSDELLITFYTAFFVLPIFAFVRLREASLRALKHVVQSEMLLRCIRPALMIIGTIWLYFWLGDKLKAQYAMAVNCVAIVATAAIGTILLHRILPRSIAQTQPKFTSTAWLKTSLPLLLIAGMAVLLKRIDIIMLGALKGTEQSGIYSAASRLSDLVIFALTAINAILAPIISELYHTGQKEKLQQIITLVARAIFAFTLIIGVTLAFSGEFILNLFGGKFTSAYSALLILLCGNVICALAGPVSLLMTMTNYQKLAGKFMLLSVIVNIILNLSLIPLLGLLGAAVSTALALSFKNIVMVFYISKKMHLQPTIFRFG